MLSLPLKNFIEHLKITAEQVPGQLLAVKDLEFRYVYVSPGYKDLLGLSESETLGKTCQQLELKPVIETDIDQIEDEEVIFNREVKSFIRIHQFATGVIPRTFVKFPIIVFDKVVGIMAQCFEFGDISKSNTYLSRRNNSSKATRFISHKAHNLTKREKQIIFFFINRNNSQEIAEVISCLEGRKVTKSTIDSIFGNQLYIKFGVYNREELYNKLIEYGYDKLIPKEALLAANFSLQTQRIY